MSQILKLESYEYKDGSEYDANGSTDITIEQTVCTLNFSYTHNNPLKYYQFYLYDSNGNLLGITNKVYSLADISYVVENYNNLQAYTLKLCCVTQNDEDVELEVTIHVQYNQNNIYADIDFVTDKEKALNNMSVHVSQLTGYGESYTYINGEYVVISKDGYVRFFDEYESIDNNFIAKLWCSNLSKDVPFLQITQANGNDYIEVFFVGNAFVAYKYSGGIKTSYISNILDIADDEEVQNKEMYFSIKEINGRIDMYAMLLS